MRSQLNHHLFTELSAIQDETVSSFVNYFKHCFCWEMSTETSHFSMSL